MMGESNHPLKEYFIGWQCRLRQHASRKEEGRPGSGMKAGLFVKISDRDLGPLNINIVQKDPEEITAEFRHVVKKTHDPKIRRESALKILSSAYYQYPKDFDETLTATFILGSELASLLIGQQECELVFEQYQQTFRLHCKVAEIPEDSLLYQATYWHNYMFNATLPAKVHVLGFTPNWDTSIADPQNTRP